MINYHCPYVLTKSPEDSGYDLRYHPQSDHPAGLAPPISPSWWQLVPTGLCLQIPIGWEGQIRPRSGLALKHGVTVLNTPGTIDAGYEGEVAVILINHGAEPFVIEPNMRIAQLVFAQVAGLPLTRSEQPLEKRSLRGDGGFGSTGVD